MKTITLATALCLLSLSSFAIGRPHNIFATHRAVATQSFLKQPRKMPEKPVTQAIDKAKETVAKSKEVISTVYRLAELLRFGR